jgi:DNA repair protein RadA/Sms
VRAVSQGDQRLKEAAKLGFTEALVPPRRGRPAPPGDNLKVHEIAHLQDLVDLLAGAAAPRRGGRPGERRA